jgi:hypothetical protein
MIMAFSDTLSGPHAYPAARRLPLALSLPGLSFATCVLFKRLVVKVCFLFAVFVQAL